MTQAKCGVCRLCWHTCAGLEGSICHLRPLIPWEAGTPGRHLLSGSSREWMKGPHSVVALCSARCQAHVPEHLPRPLSRGYTSLPVPGPNPTGHRRKEKLWRHEMVQILGRHSQTGKCLLESASSF